MTPLRQRVARILVQPSHATRLGLLSLFVHPFFALDERYGSVVPASSSPRYPCCSIKARFFYSGRHVFGGLCRVVDISLISNRNMSFYNFSFLSFFLPPLSRPFIPFGWWDDTSISCMLFNQDSFTFWKTFGRWYYMESINGINK